MQYVLNIINGNLIIVIDNNKKIILLLKDKLIYLFKIFIFN